MPSAPPTRAATRPPTAGTKPFARAAVALALWVTMAGTTVPTPLYPLYQQAFGFSPLTVTVTFAVYAAGVVAGLLTLGRLSDRVGRRPVIAGALLLAAAAAGLFEAATALPWLLVARVVSGLSAALITGAATAALLDLAPPERRQRAQTLALAATMGGLAGGTLLSGVLAEWAGSPLRSPWTVTLVLTGVALLGLRAVPGPAPDGGTAATGGAPATESVTDSGGRTARRRPGFEPLRVPADVRPALLRAALAAGSGFAVLGVLTSVSGLFLATVLGLHHHALTGLVVCLAFAATAVGQLAARVLAGPRALPAACAGLVLAAALIAAALLTASLSALVLGAVVNGLATGTAVATGLGAINAGVGPTERGGAVSAFFAVLYTMLSVPVVGVGLLIRATDLRTAGVVFSALVAALAVGVAAGLTGRRPRPTTVPTAIPTTVPTSVPTTVPTERA
ncbi:MFS transporter [Kitasatospora sp. NPDC059327]|uniref:MFS transporter n=1 Tax=Kitasatospora sp. NPDC059327 TaxID=3346803 RepID=UPI0036870B3B